MTAIAPATTTPAAAPLARYTGVAMVLHWTVAALIGLNLVLVWFADKWPEGWVRPAIDLHKSVGITVFGLVVLRLLWRAGHPPPAMPRDYPKVERTAAHLAHYALYAVILALPLSGWLHDSAWKDAAAHPLKLFWAAPFPRLGTLAQLAPGAKAHAHDLLFAVHGWLAYGLYALFGLHVAGALKHQWIDREPELQRMLPGHTPPST